MMSREVFYRNTTLILLAAVVLMGLYFFFKRPVAVPPAEVKKPARIQKAVKGRIAIVIDDLGYTSKNVSVIEGIKQKMTFSILPNLSYSSRLGPELQAMGFEVMLHLPMEPDDNGNLEPDTVLVSMDEAQIRKIIGSDLQALARVKGVSNHMGSKATKDERTLKILFSELKKRRLYFLDSFVTSKSVAREIAAGMKVKYAKRDIFLDNESDAAYIRGQLELLKDKAREKGYSIGIGHDRAATLAVLKEEMPKIAKEGYTFVFVSDLVR